MHEQDSIEDIEIDLLVEAIHRRYGHDFRNYARASLKRRLALLPKEAGVENVGALIHALLRDEALWERIFLRISVTVSEFYRDAEFFNVLRRDVFPILATYPTLRIWHAACAGGEEVYSLAILLKEAGLLERSTVFATDFNDRALGSAETAIYDEDTVLEARGRYKEAGGQHALEDYFTFSNGQAKVKQSLTQSITFANHNLATDGSFGQMHLILCRNAFIYFNSELQNRVLKLFVESLIPNAWLGIGSRESLRFTKVGQAFNANKANRSIYQLKGVQDDL